MGKASRRKKAAKEGTGAIALAPSESAFAQAVQRIHHWKPGQDPNDPDAYEGSGWTYLQLSGDYQSDVKDRRDKYKKAGGPESGYTCLCGEMTRIVDEVTAYDIFQQNFVFNGEQMAYKFTDEQKRKLQDAKVAILLCPKCERITQFRAELIPALRMKYLEEQ